MDLDLNRLLSSSTNEIAQKVKNYDKTSFISWKAAQGASYVDNISALRWEIDFKRDQSKNIKLIENWINHSDRPRPKSKIRG